MAWGLPATIPAPITVTYDMGGYRNTAPLARADVILIGDSYVEGLYVSDDQVVSSFLQARLGRPVANLGVAGYGTAQELVVLKRSGLPLEPRVAIWFFFEGNDLYNDREFLEHPHVSARPTPERLDRKRWLVAPVLRPQRPRSAPPRPARARATALSHFGTLAGGASCSAPRQPPPGTDFERGLWKQTRGTLREAARVTQAHGVNLLLVYVPIKFRGYRDFVDLPPQSEARDWTLWPLPELFTQFCRAEGLVHLDLTGMLRGAVRDRGGDNDLRSAARSAVYGLGARSAPG